MNASAALQIAATALLWLVIEEHNKHGFVHICCVCALGMTGSREGAVLYATDHFYRT